MITEKRLLEISGKYTLVAIAAILVFWFVIFGMGVCHAQTQTGYRVPAGYDCGNGARVTSRMNFQIGTGSTFIMRYGTTTVTGSGTAGYMMGTDSAYPRWVWTPATNRMNFLDITLQQNGVDIAAYGNSAALAAAINDETGTNTVVFSSSPTINNPTFTGQTTGIAFSAVAGSATASQLPTSLAEMTFTGNSNFPSGIWNSSGSVGIGTSTPATTVQVIGTVTATGFSGNGAGLTNLPSGSVAFSAVTGSATASQLPTSLAGMTFTGNTNFPSGIWNSSGNVGIGTAAPGKLLHLRSAAATDSAIQFDINGVNTAYVGLDKGASIMGSSVEGDLILWTSSNILLGVAGSPKMTIANSGNVGIGTTTPSNILTLPIASATDPIADAWTNHCLADYKDIGTETTEMIQLSANDKIKSVPVSSYTKKALISDEEAEKEVKQKYQGKIRESAKADLELYTTETGVAMQDNSYVDELLESMWETKADRITLIETNKEKLVAEKKALPKFQRKNYGIVAEDAPPEAQVFDKNGNLQGIDPSALVGILWANAQKQEIRISALEAEIDNLYIIIEVLAGILGIGGSATWLVQRRKRKS